MAARLRFGVLGTGNIAKQFAEGVAGSRRSEVTAVGSRAAESAAAFGAKFGIAARHGSYDALLADPNVDAIYNSLPNSLHHAWTIKALRAGKHVLCEKPLAVTAAEAEAMFDEAERAGRVLVEAFMYRAHPMMREVVAQVRRGAIGRLKLIRASFCYNTTNLDANVRFRPDLAGGALMDIGCYCVDFAGLIADAEPTDVHVNAHLHAKGVDDYAAGTIAFANGVVANFACGMTVQGNNAVMICGDAGYIEVPVPWKPPVSGAKYIIKGQIPPKQDQPGSTAVKPAAPTPSPTGEEHSVDAGMPLYGLEADAFAEAVLDGTTPWITRADSLRTARILDELRRQAGLAY